MKERDKPSAHRHERMSVGGPGKPHAVVLYGNDEGRTQGIRVWPSRR
jgi:hypothetical protein